MAPVAHSLRANAWSVRTSFASARSLVRLTPWSSPWRSLTARILGSSSAVSRASTSSTVIVAMRASLVMPRVSPTGAGPTDGPSVPGGGVGPDLV